MTAAAILVFAAVFAAAYAGCLALAEARRSPAAILKGRLRRMGQGEPEPQPDPELVRRENWGHRFFIKLPLMKRVTTLVERSGIPIAPPIVVLATAAASAATALALYAARGNLLLAAGGGVATVWGAKFALAWKKRSRERRFTEQLPDALTMISRSLRAGHSLTAAIELLSEELPEPAAGIFRIAYEQQKFGVRIVDALATLPERIESLDLQFFVTIIRISSETGGNLAEILDKLAETIRSRLQVRQQVQVVTAEGRLSGYVLIAMPILLFAVFYIMNPAYMGLFFTERFCQIALVFAAVAQCVGLFLIRKVIDIRI
ncbi:type II secretion system F family protein [Geomesophilobacter sediminis]|uniref:Type II secretion system F family protein n=1 Tax=Geomesophilobacter sediminis TaxID=2798584 RepID=A0A8J7M0K9_9BACT|nr:type II secretion system F family protein [Geomesophilobacter sediminis]MBJ6725727.1 type II secretion system F family protein [Geomesophilobacter sediminis]